MYVCATDPERAYYEAYLDGARVDRCYSANVDSGWVEVYLEPPITWDPFKNENIPNVKRLSGRVEIVNIITGKVFR